MREPSPEDLARLAELQRAMLRLVMLEERRDVDGRLTSAAIDELDDPAARSALRALPPRRLGLYRRLVRGTLVEAVRVELPRTYARFGAVLDASVEAFCDEELPCSPILREVPFEFVRWALPRWRCDAALPAWLGDLARLELLEFDAHCAERGFPEVASSTVPADRPLAFDGTVRLGVFDWAFAREEVEPLPDPTPRPHGLVLHRDSDNEVHRLDVDPVVLAVLAELVLSGRSLADAMRAAAGPSATEPSKIELVARSLEALADRSALLGVAARSAPRRPSPWHGLVGPAGVRWSEAAPPGFGGVGPI